MTIPFSFRVSIFLAICIGSLGPHTPSVSMAQEVEPAGPQSVYKAVGGPTTPKVDVHWNRYRDNQQIADLLKGLAEAYPNLSRLESIGKSIEGRDIWVITITDFNSGEESHKPGFWIDAGIHANEIQATEVALYTAWFLLEMHGENEFVQNLLRDRVFYILPDLSPDSREAHFYNPNTTNSPRSGQRPVDDDRDGRVNEDGLTDLNGDGHITQMRIRDPKGRYKSHPEYPALMIPVADDEQGEYALLGSEGIDNDGDGRVGEDGDGSYDPNRDWPWNWEPSYVQRGAFRYPFSLIENRVLAEFVLKHPNIAGAQTYHNTGGMLLRGPGAKSDSYQSQDLAVYDQIGRVGARILPNYRYMNVADDLYEVFGGEIDWFHQVLGVFTFTNELFAQYNYFHDRAEQGSGQGPGGPGGPGRGQARSGSGPLSNPGPITGSAPRSGQRDISHEFDRYLLFGDGLVPWEEVDHPVYGKVEVGGVKKNWGRQPPGFMLQEECHRNMAFTLYHADQMPLVKIEEVNVKQLADQLFEVTAIVENTRVIPTHSAVDVQKKITRPNHVSIEGEGIKVALGSHSSDFLFQRANIAKKDPATIKVTPLGGKSRTYVRWIVQGSGNVTIKTDTIKGGRDEQSVELTAADEEK